MGGTNAANSKPSDVQIDVRVLLQDGIKKNVKSKREVRQQIETI